MDDLKFQQIYLPFHSYMGKGNRGNQKCREIPLLERSSTETFQKACFKEQELATQRVGATRGVMQREGSSAQSPKDRLCAWPVS